MAAITTAAVATPPSAIHSPRRLRCLCAGGCCGTGYGVGGSTSVGIAETGDAISGAEAAGAVTGIPAGTAAGEAVGAMLPSALRKAAAP